MEAVYHPGLDGIVAAQTRLSWVDGRNGVLVIAGFPVEELASHATFEETVYLLWHDRLPNDDELSTFHQQLAARRAIPPYMIELLRHTAYIGAPIMDALRMGAASIPAESEEVRRADGELEPAWRHDALMLVARFPTIVAAYSRLKEGFEPVHPRDDLGHTANFLYMLRGTEPDDEEVRGLETYFNTVVDHGLNASTFSARVIVSTESDMISAVTGAIGALKGPLHGGAPGPALDMVFDIGEADRAEAYLRAKLERGERLMGFGHRIYKVRDPRAEVLEHAAERMFRRAGDTSLYHLTRHVERVALRLLDEYKPGRNLRTNVEFYTALLLHGLGLPSSLFTPCFAIGRVGGWTAHCFEQLHNNRIFRPTSIYTGRTDRQWISIEDRE
ncbi:MAG: citrate synthase/methylcitrate synthase [Armatimonadetes bacterium]|nr:citrate synthase/methylcitrate synthase [Armatimonadota bacterium]